MKVLSKSLTVEGWRTETTRKTGGKSTRRKPEDDYAADVFSPLHRGWRLSMTTPKPVYDHGVSYTDSIHHQVLMIIPLRPRYITIYTAYRCQRYLNIFLHSCLNINEYLTTLTTPPLRFFFLYVDCYQALRRKYKIPNMGPKILEINLREDSRPS